jgi:hypothetical protein
MKKPVNESTFAFVCIFAAPLAGFALALLIIALFS